jgi:hypothetical protein
MQAFPKDSLNNVLGGGGPLNKKPDHAAFLGNNDRDAFKDYARAGEGGPTFESYNPNIRDSIKGPQPAVISPLMRVEPIHGEESLGLGTSTFLDGAPASRNAIQRRNTEKEPGMDGGLGRKKSLAQKIRGISNNRRDIPGQPGRVTSPGDLNATSPRSPEYTPGGTATHGNEKNPFFNEEPRKNSFDEEKRDEGKGGENITIVESASKSGRARAPSSPGRRGFGERLERRVTGDGSGEEPKSGGMGFLNRVKSLKTGRRAPPRPEKPLPTN